MLPGEFHGEAGGVIVLMLSKDLLHNNSTNDSGLHFQFRERKGFRSNRTKLWVAF